MEVIIKFVLFVDAIFALKILGSMVRAKWRKEIYVNDKLWARCGMLIMFHLVMLVVSGFFMYIMAIVNAAL